MYPNLFGVLIFTAWPLVIFWLFKKVPPQQAVFLSIVVATLLLPAGYVVDYPLLPPLDRSTLTALTLMFLLFINKQKNPMFKPGFWNFLYVAYILTIITSTFLNMDTVETGLKVLRPSTPYDALSNTIIFVLSFIPFILGRNLFKNPQDTEYLFKVLTITALIYSVPMLYEIRMSPQLHIMVYGYFPGDFLQQIREGGFRPVVFVGHGLGMAFWFTIATITSIALHKANVQVTKFFGFKVILYFIVVLLLCKTLSAVIYIIFATILMYFFTLKKQILFSLLITIMVMLYPLNSTSQFVKNDDVLNLVSQYSKEREQSLETRFDNEQRLLTRAMERPYFGWSGWGRNRVYAFGKDITITDGRWVMEVGSYGLVGFVLYYLILLYPILAALKSYRYLENEKHRIYFATLAIITAIGIFDSVPNFGMMPVHLLLAGVLLGQSKFVKQRYLQKRLEEIQARATG